MHKREEIPVIAYSDKWQIVFDSKTKCAEYFGIRIDYMNRLIDEGMPLPQSKHPLDDPFEIIWIDELFTETDIKRQHRK